jgi:hypothetical protein
MAIRHKIWMRQLREKLDFDEDLFQPGMIIADGNSFASKVAEVAAINFVSHEQNDTLATLSEDLLLDKESAEVIWTESLSTDPAAFGLGDTGGTGHKLDIIREAGR